MRLVSILVLFFIFTEKIISQDLIEARYNFILTYIVQHNVTTTEISIALKNGNYIIKSNFCDQSLRNNNNDLDYIKVSGKYKTVFDTITFFDTNNVAVGKYLRKSSILELINPIDTNFILNYYIINGCKLNCFSENIDRIIYLLNYEIYSDSSNKYINIKNELTYTARNKCLIFEFYPDTCLANSGHKTDRIYNSTNPKRFIKEIIIIRNSKIIRKSRVTNYYCRCYTPFYNGDNVMSKGKEKNDLKIGKWKYYAMDGKLSHIEKYQKGKLLKTRKKY